jgi:hypothetical protein
MQQRVMGAVCVAFLLEPCLGGLSTTLDGEPCLFSPARF